MRALTAATRRRLREIVERSALGVEVMDFLEAVVLHAAHPLGGQSRAGDAKHEQAVGTRAIEIMVASLGDERSVSHAATALADDAALLAAFFQNLDLLPGSGLVVADAIALLVVMASSRLPDVGR